MNAFQISAGNVPPATASPVELGQHRHQRCRVADPDGGGELRRVADEPRVAVVLGRAGLPGDRAVRRACARLPVPERTAFCRIVLIDRGLRPSVERVDPASASLNCVLPPCAELLDHARACSEDRAVDAAPPFAKRRIRAGHLERRDRLGAEPDREVRRWSLLVIPIRRAPSRRRSSGRRAASAARRRRCPRRDRRLVEVDRPRYAPS